MYKLREVFSSSARELKDMRTLAVTAMLMAVAVILGFFGTVQIGDYLKIGFSFIANELTALMFGPAVGGIMAGAAVVVNIGLNTLWLSMLYGQAFHVLLPARALKQLVMVPVETALFYAVVVVLQRAGVFGAIRVKIRK